MARPRKVVDKDLIEKLAAIHCTVEEIAATVGVSKDTLERRYAALIKKGKERGKMSLRRQMWEKATTGNVTMQIWLSKNILGYTDRQEMSIGPKDGPKPSGFFIEGLEEKTEPLLSYSDPDTIEVPADADKDKR